MVSRGRGRPLWADVDGTAVRNGQSLTINSTRGSLGLPADEVISEVVCVPGRDVLVVAAPGPNLLPVPAVGTTAQRFGAYPEAGPSLWTVSVDSGKCRKVAESHGIETIRQPQYLDGSRIVYAGYHQPAYGTASASRLRVVALKAQTIDDDDLYSVGARREPYRIFGPGDVGMLRVHSNRTAYPPWYQLVVALPDGTFRYPLPATVRLSGEPPVWSEDGRWLAITAFDGIAVGVIRVAVTPEAFGSWR